MIRDRLLQLFNNQSRGVKNCYTPGVDAAPPEGGGHDGNLVIAGFFLGLAMFINLIK